MKYFTLIIILIIVAINHESFNICTGKKTAFLGDSSRYYILLFNKNEQQSYFDGNVNSTTISESELKQIEYILKDAVKQHNNQIEKLHKKNRDMIQERKYQFETTNIKIRNLARYYKQLIAVTNTKGEKVIFVNCCCNRTDINRLHTDLIITEDGGSCYFNLKINLTKKITYDFFVNGVA